MGEDIKKLKKRFEQLKEERRGWENHWQELTEYLLPRRGKYLNGAEDTNSSDRGKKKNDKIKKSVVFKCVNTLASGMQGGLTSPSRPWFRLRIPNDKLMEVASVKEWLYYIEQSMAHIFAKSNAYGVLYSVYEELGVYGTAAMIVEEDLDTIIHCRPLTIGEYYIALDSRLRPDTLYRKFQMTAGQMVEEFGENKVSEAVKNAYKNDKTEQKFAVIHVVQPKKLFDKNKKEHKYVSCYYEEKSNNEKFLRESGYTSMPFMCPRWNAISDDCYGESPAMHALGDIKEVQKITDLKLEGIERTVRPSWIADASLKGQINTNPNGITYVTTQQAMAGLQPAHKVSIQLGEVRQEINEIINDIRQCFFVDLFLSITNQTKEMTVPEVQERKAEKMLMLGQVIERLESELLDTLIDRTFDIMKNLDLIPPPPKEIGGMEIKVEYISLLSQAQKSSGTSAITQTAMFVGQLMQANPPVADKFDFDEAVDQYSDMVGNPPKLVRSDDAVAKIRAARQKQQEQAQAQMQLQQATQGAKTLADTKMGQNSALDAIMAKMGGGQK